MQQEQRSFEIRTAGRGLYDITPQVRQLADQAGFRTGLVTVFCQHTSASLVIAENADPSASTDLLRWLERIAPDGDPQYTHDAEGPDDMAAHLRSALTRTSESIPIVRSKLGLGTWQGIYLLEHRTSAHSRSFIVHAIGA